MCVCVGYHLRGQAPGLHKRGSQLNAGTFPIIRYPQTVSEINPTSLSQSLLEILPGRLLVKREGPKGRKGIKRSRQCWERLGKEADVTG